eukprot:2562957-Prymnesium_polylepis.1
MNSRVACRGRTERASSSARLQAQRSSRPWQGTRRSGGAEAAAGEVAASAALGATRQSRLPRASQACLSVNAAKADGQAERVIDGGFAADLHIDGCADGESQRRVPPRDIRLVGAVRERLDGVDGFASDGGAHLGKRHPRMIVEEQAEPIHLLVKNDAVGGGVRVRAYLLLVDPADEDRIVHRTRRWREGVRKLPVREHIYRLAQRVVQVDTCKQ